MGELSLACKTSQDVVMRIYLPITTDAIASLRDLGRLDLAAVTALNAVGLGFVQTPQWQEAQDEDDQEVLEDTLLELATDVATDLASDLATDLAMQMATRLKAQVPNKFVTVLVAELAPESLAIESDSQGVANLLSDIGFKQIQAFFAGISNGNVAEEVEMSWFGPSELPELLDFLGLPQK